MVRLRAAAFLVATTVASPASALTAVEKARLESGDSVVEPMALHRDGKRLVGGVSYRIVDAESASLSLIVRDPRRYGEIFPKLAFARLERIDSNGRAHVRFEHAMGPFRGGYTMILACSDKGRFCKFWLDTEADNALDAGWGYVRLTPLPGGRTLVTYALLFDLGPGIVRSLFEEKIQRAALDVPRKLAWAAGRP